MPEKKSVIKEKGYTTVTMSQQKLYTVTIVLFVLLNMVLGMMSEPILHIIQTGLSNFA